MELARVLMKAGMLVFWLMVYITFGGKRIDRDSH